ncbi:MAG: hypothetical protein ACOCOY_07690, partial [Prevotella sp.]
MVSQISAGRLTLNDALLNRLGVDISKARQTMIDWLLKDNRIRFAVDYDHVAEATIPEIIKERIING